MLDKPKQEPIKPGTTCWCYGKKAMRVMYYGYEKNGLHYFYSNKGEAVYSRSFKATIGVHYTTFTPQYFDDNI